MKIIIIIECGWSSNCTQGYRLHQPGKPCCVQFWRTEILKAFSDSFACTVRSCRQLAQNAHISIHTHTYKSDNLIYHCTLSGTETGAAHTLASIHCVCVQGCALCCSLGRWLRPKIVHEIMAVSAVCHILGHL